MSSKTLETILTGRNELSPVLATAARDVTAYAATVDAANTSAGESATKSAAKQRAAADQVIEANSKIKLSAEDAAKQIGDVRDKLAELGGRRLGVDVDTVDARMQLADIKTRLDEVAASKPTARVAAETAAAQAELRAIQAELNSIDGKRVTAKVDADTSQAEQGFQRAQSSSVGLLGAVGAIAPALIPVAAAALAGAAAFGTMAMAGVAAAGVMAIAFGGVVKAVQLLGQQQQQQQAADLQSAQQADAHAQAIVNAQRQIASAQMALGDAERQANDQRIQSAEAVANAQYGIVQANQRVEAAQYSLAQADQAEQNAVRALTDAREAASRQLETYANQAVDTQLAEKQAVLDLQTAQNTYRTTMASTTATEQQKQQAALDLQKAQQRLTEAQQAATNAAEDNQKAQQAGVDGSQQVITAQQGVASATHNVAGAQQALADAQHGQRQAQQALADAQRKAAEQQITSQEAITRAQQGVAAAADAMAAAQRASAGTTAASLQQINDKVAQLDPATRNFAEYLRGTWSQVWKNVQAAAAGGLLPGVQAGLDNLLPIMPGVTSLIGTLASTMGELFKQASQALGGPFWQHFLTDITHYAGPLLSDMARALGNIATGFAGIVDAFLPMDAQIGDGLVGLTRKFSEWGQNLANNPGFLHFVQYVRDNWPGIKQIVENVATAIGHIVEAGANLGGSYLGVLQTLSGVLAGLPVGVVEGLVGAFTGLKVAQSIVGPIGSLADGLKKISGLDGAAGVVGKIAGALPGVGAALGIAVGLAPPFIDFLKGTPSVADQASKSVQGIADAIDATNGKIDESVRKQAALKIQQLGLADAASRWGVSTKDLVDAITGVPGAMDKVRSAADQYQRGLDGINTGYGNMTGQIDQAKRKSDDYLTALDKLAGGVSGAEKQHDDLTKAVYGSVQAQAAMDKSSQTLRDAVQNAGAVMQSSWDENTAVLGGATEQQKAHLRDLGLAILNVPGMPGHPAQVVVTANTGPAKDEIQALLDSYKNYWVNINPQGMALTTDARNLLYSGGKATGGPIVGPGTGTSDTAGLYALSNGEHVWTAAETQAAGGHAGVEQLRRAVLAAGRGRAQGGPVGWNIGMTAPAALDPDSFVAAMRGMQQASAAAQAAAQAVASSAGGSARWRPQVDAVLAMLGVPLSADNGVLSLIQSESGGNPNAINLWDSNAKAGHPSQGLMQTIPGTFARWRNPSLPNNILDPLANIYAGVNYALHTYGLQMLMGGGRHTASGAYMGYAGGGDAPARTPFWVGERGPELVWSDRAQYVSTAEQSGRVAAAFGAVAYNAAGTGFTAAAAPGYGAPTSGRTTVMVAAPPAPQVTVHVHVDGQEFRGMTRVEIDKAMGDLADFVHNTVGR